MKKKYTLIPVIAIILAVLTGLFISLFTTPVLAYVTENKSSVTEIKDKHGNTLYYDYDDWFYTVKKTGKITQFAYTLNPTVENLFALCNLYKPETYIKGTHKGNTPTPDFLKCSVKYQKLYYETEYKEEECVYAVPNSSFTDDPIFLFYKVPNGLEYAKALYLDGQIDSSQKVIEELVNGLNKSNEHDRRYFTLLAKDYFYLVYSSTENVTVKQWVLEKEEQLAKMIENDEWAINFIKSHGSLFSNPDYDTYVSGDWSDRTPIEDEEVEPDETTEYITD